VVCNARGAVPGEAFVTGRAFINTSYEYYRSHLWRNYGILVGFIIFFLGTYLYATEIVTAKKSKGEVLVFPRSHLPKAAKQDQEGGAVNEKATVVDGNASVGTEKTMNGILRQTKVFHWSDVCYDIKIKGQPRRILDHVDGWVKPGTLTALMVRLISWFAPD